MKPSKSTQLIFKERINQLKTKIKPSLGQLSIPNSPKVESFCQNVSARTVTLESHRQKQLSNTHRSFKGGISIKQPYLQGLKKLSKIGKQNNQDGESGKRGVEKSIQIQDILMNRSRKESQNFKANRGQRSNSRIGTGRQISKAVKDKQKSSKQYNGIRISQNKGQKIAKREGGWVR